MDPSPASPLLMIGVDEKGRMQVASCVDATPLMVIGTLELAKLAYIEHISTYGMPLSQQRPAQTRDGNGAVVSEGKVVLPTG